MIDHRKLAPLAACGAIGLSIFCAVPASAAPGSPRWTVTSVSSPTNFAPGDQSGEDAYRVTVTNTGGVPSNGEPIAIVDELPEGEGLSLAGEA